MTAQAAAAAPAEGAGDKGVPLADAKSLLEGVKGEDKAAKPGHPAHQEPQAPADPAKGDQKPQRPDHIPENFWDAEKGQARVDDLAKAFADLRGKIARGEHKPPAKAEDYKISVPDGVTLRKDDPVVPVFLKAAHEQGLSQAQLDAIVAPVLAAAAKMPRDAGPSEAEIRRAQDAAAAEEMKQLGPQAQAIVKNAATFLDGLLAKGTLSPDEHKGLRGSLTTAAALRGFTKLMQLGQPGTVPLAAPVTPGAGSYDEGHALLMEGFAKGGEATAEGRELLKRGREILQNLERQGVLPASVPAGLGVGRAAKATG